MTKIEWCDLTLNPIVGCSKCSPGCEHCYAEKFAARLAKTPNSKTAAKYSGVIDDQGKWTGKLSEEGWDCLERLAGMAFSLPKRIFIGSMTDMFHENMDQGSFNELVDLMTYTGARHTFLLLTKRPAHALEMVLAYENGSGWARDGLPGHESHRLPKNVWLGVTVCNQQEADEKIPILLDIPAATRFISVEPMLGRIDLSKFLERQIAHEKCRGLCLPGSNDGGIGNRCTRPDLAHSLPERESLDAPNPYNPLPKKTCRKIIGEVSASASDDRRSARECPCTSACMDSLQRADSSGSYDKSQEWDHVGQSARKSGAGDLFGTTAAFLPCSENTTQTRSHGQISWVICGAETGSGARTMNLEWARELRDQCKKAGVPYFFKKAGNKKAIPDDLMVREWPEVNHE